MVQIPKPKLTGKTDLTEDGIFSSNSDDILNLLNLIVDLSDGGVVENEEFISSDERSNEIYDLFLKKDIISSNVLYIDKISYGDSTCIRCGKNRTPWTDKDDINNYFLCKVCSSYVDKQNTKGIPWKKVTINSNKDIFSLR